MLETILKQIPEQIPILITLLIAMSGFGLSFYVFVRDSRTRRRKLINAVYYHVTLAVESLENLLENNEWIKRNIEEDESYMPYVVRSSADDSDI